MSKWDDLKQKVEALSEKRGWAMDTVSDAHCLTVHLDGGRSQVVWVHTNNKDIEGNDVVTINSRACEIKKIKSGKFFSKRSDSLLELLDRNFSTTHVKFVADTSNGTILSQVDRFLDNLTLKELETLVFACANQADSLEKEKDGGDSE
jgi:hypothetical protein